MAKQQAAYDTMANWLPTGDESNVKGALVSIEPGTGKIIAMVQNTNYGEPSNDDPTATSCPTRPTLSTVVLTLVVSSLVHPSSRLFWPSGTNGACLATRC